MPNHKQHGFTIVELLIVVVVIAILASITIIAFNGIRTRAANTQMQSIVSSHAKTLRLYITQNGSYPVGLGAGTCFDGTATCWAGAVQANSDILTAALQQVSSSYPAPPAPAGIVLTTGTTTDTTKGGNYTGWYIAYVLQTNTTCGPVSGSYFLNSTPGSPTTICRVAVPVDL